MAKSYPPAILVTCEDDYLLETRVKEIIGSLVPESNRMFGLEDIDCAVDTIDASKQAMDATRNALVQQGFFSEDKTIWMRNLTFLEAKRLQKSDTFNDNLASFCDWLTVKGIPEGFTLLVSAPKIPKTSRFYKLFTEMAKNKLAVIEEIKQPDARSALSVVLAAAKKIGYEMPTQVAEEVVDRAGASPRVLAMEVEKLYLYTNGTAPKAEDVEAICTVNAEGQFWDLTDAFGNRDLKKTLVVLHNLYERGVEPVFLVIQLETRLSELYLVNDSIRNRTMSMNGSWAGSLSAEDVDAVGGLGKFEVTSKKPWSLSRIVSQAVKWKPSELRYARTVMNTAHERMVRITVDAENLLEMAISDALKV